MRRKIKTLTMANFCNVNRGRFDEVRKCRSGQMILHLHFIKMTNAHRIFPLASSNFSLSFHHMMKWETSVDFVFSTLFSIFIPNIIFFFLLLQKQTYLLTINMSFYMSVNMCVCMFVMGKEKF